MHSAKALMARPGFLSLLFLMAQFAGHEVHAGLLIPLDFSPTGISNDGAIVVGDIGGNAVRWTATTGTSVLTAGQAYAISQDGTTIVGSAEGSAFRWTQASGVDLLFAGAAYGVSPDGRDVVGSSGSVDGCVRGNGLPCYRYGDLMRWSEDAGSSVIGTERGAAFGVSANGATIVGAAGPLDGLTRFFRWRELSGYEYLLDPIPVDYQGEARALTPDGTTVVGWSGSGWSESGFVWTVDGASPLPNCTGDNSTGCWRDYAVAVSNVGDRIVGFSDNGSFGSVQVAMLWIEGVAVGQTLGQLLRANGTIETNSEWRFLNATAISGDGNWVVGNGIDPDGNRRGYLANVAVLVPVPVPAAAWLFASALGGLAGLRRWSR